MSAGSPTPAAAVAGVKMRGEDKTSRIPIKIVPAERLKKPGGKSAARSK